MLNESWDMNSRFDINAPQVVADFVDGEVVAVNLETGTYFALYGFSALVWEALSQGASPREILDVIIPHPERRDVMAGDIEDFVNVLQGHHLLRARESDAPAVDTEPLVSSLRDLPWDPLRVFAHSDLQDILLLDPVHDTSDAGWPEAREADPRETTDG
jgi:hypothetical protein